MSIELDSWNPGSNPSASVAIAMASADCRSGLVLDGIGQGFQITFGVGTVGRRYIDQNIKVFGSDTITVAGSPVTAIPPGRIATGNLTAMTSNVPVTTNYYQLPKWTLKMVVDSGLARKGPTLLTDQLGTTTFTIKGGSMS
jgi:hypothetical protein